MPAPTYQEWAEAQALRGAGRAGHSTDVERSVTMAIDPRQYEQNLLNYDFTHPGGSNMTARDAQSAILESDKRKRVEAARREAEAQRQAEASARTQYQDAYRAEQARLQQRFPGPAAAV